MNFKSTKEVPLIEVDDNNRCLLLIKIHYFLKAENKQTYIGHKNPVVFRIIFFSRPGKINFLHTYLRLMQKV